MNRCGGLINSVSPDLTSFSGLIGDASDYEPLATGSHWGQICGQIAGQGAGIGISGPMYQEHEMTNCAGVTHPAWAGIKSTNMNHENSHLPLGIRKSGARMSSWPWMSSESMDLVHFICLFSCLSVCVFECLAAGAGLGGIPVTWRHGPAWHSWHGWRGHHSPVTLTWSAPASNGHSSSGVM